MKPDHPLMENLPLTFNVTAPSEVGFWPDSVIPVNGSISLTKWTNYESAIVLYNGSDVGAGQVFYLAYTTHYMHASPELYKQIVENVFKTWMPLRPIKPPVGGTVIPVNPWETILPATLLILVILTILILTAPQTLKRKL